MKLPNIRRVYIANHRSNGSYVRFSTTGQVAISSGAVEALSIPEESKAVFFQDQEDKKVWYFGFGPEGDYPIKRIKNKPEDKTMSFSNKVFKDVVLNSLGNPKGTVRLHLAYSPLVLEGSKLWRITLDKK